MDITPQETIDAPAPYLLQVGGVGCFMLLTSNHITIGGIEDLGASDVTLQTAGVRSPIRIDRQADRYLARADSSFRVDGRTASSKLLLTGDTLEVGDRGRLRFMKPVPASATALLRPTAAPLHQNDVRSVVLMRELLLFGPRGTHLHIPQLRQTIVLTHTHGRFWLRELRQSSDKTASLQLNEPVEFLDVPFVLRRPKNHAEATSHGNV